MPKPIPDLLHAAIRRLRVVRLTVKGADGGAFGVPVSLSSSLVVLQFLRDFRPDGYVAVPVPLITEVRSSAFERTYTRLCAAEGILPKLRDPRGLDTTHLLDLLADLRRARKYVLITHLTDAGPRITLGPIAAISDVSVTLHPFDATGTWLPTPTHIPLPTLLDLQWSSRYLTIWQRHLPRP